MSDYLVCGPYMGQGRGGCLSGVPKMFKLYEEKENSFFF